MLAGTDRNRVSVGPCGQRRDEVPRVELVEPDGDGLPAEPGNLDREPAVLPFADREHVADAEQLALIARKVSHGRASAGRPAAMTPAAAP